MPTPDFFASRATTYDELRPADANWHELCELLVREAGLVGQRVLDVGCGTGRFVAAVAGRARVWGVDPSPEMLSVAQSRGVSGAGFREGAAERLPFRDGWFDRAVLWLVIHLVDRPRAFAEARRVLAPEGRLAIATFDPAHFDEYWLNRLFPSLEAVDRGRFPTRDQLAAELDAAGFGTVRFIQHVQRATLDREAALAKIRGRHISTFDLLDPGELEAGTVRAERELPDRIDYELDWLVALAERA